ncbi:hypothetical protein J6590_064390 [Homalodisca vitripennis]|nr:hypothetical protein J6590_064390 [Homalodisca vitripennis]
MKASSHIDKLVLKQRITAPKKSSSTFYSRRGGYNGRPRRRPPCGIPPALPKSLPKKVPSTFDPDFMKNVLWELFKKVAGSKACDRELHVYESEA